MKKEHEQILRLLQTAEDRNCTKCLHWQNDETCGLYKVRPPASVIVVGCEQYDYIPF